MVAQIDKAYIRHRASKIFARLVSYAVFEGRPLTTKGRWINWLVFGGLKLQKAVNPPRSVTSPIFIIGTGRSGTTILGVVMSMHKEVGFLNEPKAIWNSAYPFEDLVGSYSSGDAHYSLDREQATPAVKRAMHRIYGWYLWFSRSARVVDKYPELIFRPDFVREIFPDAKFIFLVRNGWDTCISIDNWSDRLGKAKDGQVHNWWGVNNRKWKLLLSQLAVEDPDFGPVCETLRTLRGHKDMAAVEWVLAMRAGMRLRETHPESVLTVRYEELVRQPTVVLERIRQFCGLSADEVYLSYGAQALRAGKGGAHFRLHPSVEAPFRATMVELGYDAQ